MMMHLLLVLFPEIKIRRPVFQAKIMNFSAQTEKVNKVKLKESQLALETEISITDIDILTLISWQKDDVDASSSNGVSVLNDGTLPTHSKFILCVAGYFRC